MSSIADSAIHIQTSSQSIPSTPSWFGEVTIMAHYLRRIGVLAAISERVRFARRRFGRYCQGQLTFDPFRQLEMDPPAWW